MVIYIGKQFDSVYEKSLNGNKVQENMCSLFLETKLKNNGNHSMKVET